MERPVTKLEAVTFTTQLIRNYIGLKEVLGKKNLGYYPGAFFEIFLPGISKSLMHENLLRKFENGRTS